MSYFSNMTFPAEYTALDDDTRVAWLCELVLALATLPGSTQTRVILRAALKSVKQRGGLVLWNMERNPQRCGCAGTKDGLEEQTKGEILTLAPHWLWNFLFSWKISDPCLPSRSSHTPRCSGFGFCHSRRANSGSNRCDTYRQSNTGGFQIKQPHTLFLPPSYTIPWLFPYSPVHTSSEHY